MTSMFRILLHVSKCVLLLSFWWFVMWVLNFQHIHISYSSAEIYFGVHCILQPEEIMDRTTRNVSLAVGLELCLKKGHLNVLYENDLESWNLSKILTFVVELEVCGHLVR